MNTKVKTKEGLIKEVHKLQEEYDLLKASYTRDIIGYKQTEQTLKECENNLKERNKELNGIYSLGNLTEEFNKLEDIYHAFVNNVVCASMQFPDKVFVSLEIDRSKYCNIENFELSENQEYLSAPIKIFGKQAGELIVAYTEDAPFIDFFEQKLINSYAERISKITERIKTQQTLEESEVNYRSLVDNLGEGIGIVNVNEEFLFANSAAERIFGVGKGELLGKSLKEFLNEDQYMSIQNQTKIRTKGQNSIYEFELTRTDGEKRNILITAVPQFNDDNKFIGTHGIFRDFTEQKRTEKALQESEEKFKSIMENSADAIFLSNQQGKYVYTNKAVCALLGYTSEEMKSKTIIDLSPPNKVEEHFEFFKKILSEGKGFTEMELLKKDGNYISTDLNAVILPDGMVYGSRRDITERKQVELSLKESEKQLLRLNADKDRFISILGHDLKNPFNNILGLSKVLIEEISSFNTAEIEDIARNINESARITNNLLEGILMWARTQQGKIPFNPQNLSFTGICRDVVEVLKPDAITKNITLNYSASAGVKVYTDIDMLKTILRNLVSNAIKFTKSGGTINITAERTDSILTISVSDNGIGITPNNLVKLFDISEILTTKGTANESGTGLGLLLCKEFVEKHGGKIWAESEVDKGSDFKFTLPLKPGVLHHSVCLPDR